MGLEKPATTDYESFGVGAGRQNTAPEHVAVSEGALGPRAIVGVGVGAPIKDLRDAREKWIGR